jgi:hypothetical protein
MRKSSCVSWKLKRGTGAVDRGNDASRNEPKSGTEQAVENFATAENRDESGIMEEPKHRPDTKTKNQSRILSPRAEKTKKKSHTEEAASRTNYLTHEREYPVTEIGMRSAVRVSPRAGNETPARSWQPDTKSTQKATKKCGRLVRN